MTRVQIYLDEKLLEMLNQEAKDNDVSRSDIIRKRLYHSYNNDVVYVDYVNAELETAHQIDLEASDD